MVRNKMDEVLVMGINMLAGADSRYLTVVQVANLARAYRDATGESAFAYPDYTCEVYIGGRDGWKLSRFPNKAGLITRIKQSEVKANSDKRDTNHKIEEMCRDINVKFLTAVESGRDPMSDPDYVSAVENYRQFCASVGLNK